MKRVFKAIGNTIRFIVGMAGMILCMCETEDEMLQVVVLVGGFALIVLVALPSLLKEEEWEAN